LSPRGCDCTGLLISLDPLESPPRAPHLAGVYVLLPQILDLLVGGWGMISLVVVLCNGDICVLRWLFSFELRTGRVQRRVYDRMAMTSSCIDFEVDTIEWAII
jgi:hypothetical protein